METNNLLNKLKSGLATKIMFTKEANGEKISIKASRGDTERPQSEERQEKVSFKEWSKDQMHARDKKRKKTSIGEQEGTQEDKKA